MRVTLNVERKYEGARHSPGSTIDVREDLAAAWVMRGYAEYVDDAAIGTARFSDDVGDDDDAAVIDEPTGRDAPPADAVLSHQTIRTAEAGDTGPLPPMDESAYPPDATPLEPVGDDLESLTVPVLTERAKVLGVDVKDKRKADLIDAIRATEAS